MDYNYNIYVFIVECIITNIDFIFKWFYSNRKLNIICGDEVLHTFKSQVEFSKQVYNFLNFTV